MISNRDSFSSRQREFLEQSKHGNAAQEQTRFNAGQVGEQQPVDAWIEAGKPVLRGAGRRDRAERSDNTEKAAQEQSGHEQVSAQRAGLATDARGRELESTAPDRLGGARGNGG